MKAKLEASCVERESCRAVAVLMDGGVSKKGNKKSKSGGFAVHGRKGEENTEEMKQYLGKLQELVPFMPKNKRLSKLEVISHVIDYIHDLRETLGLPPCQQNEMDCAAIDDEEDTMMEDRCDDDSHEQLVSIKTFKVSLVKESSATSSVSNSEPICDPKTTSALSRLPLSSISTPRNTEASDAASSDDNTTTMNSS